MRIKKTFLFILTALIVVFTTACSSEQVNSNKTKQVSSTNTTDKLKQQIENMSIEEKVGQLFEVKFPSAATYTENDTQYALNEIKKYHLGGIVVGADNLRGITRDQFINRIKKFQSESAIPLTVSTDQEGGEISFLNGNTEFSKGVQYPTPQEAFSQGGVENVVSWSKRAAKELSAVGVNWNFAPDADVSTNRDSYIYDRTLGQNYEVTAQYISKAVKAMQSQNVAATVKHFPGYGSAGNTHTENAESNLSKQYILSHDLLPFKAAVKAGVDSIMVTHVSLNKIDKGVPASLSKKDINLLRKDLNYQGVIITDSLQMGAVRDYVTKYNLNRDEEAFKAGNDVILSSDYQTAIPTLIKKFKNNELSTKQLNESVYRIMTMKKKLGLNIKEA